MLHYIQIIHKWQPTITNSTVAFWRDNFWSYSSLWASWTNLPRPNCNKHNRKQPLMPLNCFWIFWYNTMNSFFFFFFFFFHALLSAKDLRLLQTILSTPPPRLCQIALPNSVTHQTMQILAHSTFHQLFLGSEPWQKVPKMVSAWTSATAAARSRASKTGKHDFYWRTISKHNLLLHFPIYLRLIPNFTATILVDSISFSRNGHVCGGCKVSRDSSPARRFPSFSPSLCNGQCEQSVLGKGDRGNT